MFVDLTQGVKWITVKNETSVVYVSLKSASLGELTTIRLKVPTHHQSQSYDDIYAISLARSTEFPQLLIRSYD